MSECVCVLLWTGGLGITLAVIVRMRGAEQTRCAIHSNMHANVVCTHSGDTSALMLCTVVVVAPIPLFIWSAFANSRSPPLGAIRCGCSMHIILHTGICVQIAMTFRALSMYCTIARYYTAISIEMRVMLERKIEETSIIGAFIN